MPKYFPFYNPDEHQEIIRLLEQKAPLAIIAATDRNPELVGALYPFPLFEDGDFDIPSVFLTGEQGLVLAKLAGEPVSLISKAQRIKAQGFNVSAQKVGRSGQRIVLTAHIDARIGSPGALDDGSGIVILLLLAELLQDYAGEMGIELLAFNGEDYYSAPGQIAYLKKKQAELQSIIMDINLDDVGYIRGNTAFSFYDCPEAIVDLSRKVLLSSQGIVEGEQWYQGDHMVFVQNHIPALAIISENYQEAMREFTHTAKDRPDIVDPARLVQVALTLRELLYELNANLA